MRNLQFKTLPILTSIIALIIILQPKKTFADEGLKLLRSSPNAFALIRHAKAPGTGDPPQFKIGDCKTQRNLSRDGIEQAKEMGLKIRAELGPNFSVVSSQWCRAQDTAREISRDFRDDAVLNSFFKKPISDKDYVQKFVAWMKQNPTDTPKILITHQVNITALTQVFPAEGEILIVQPKSGSLQVLARSSLK